MAECIEREAAIEAVKKERDYMGKFSFEEEHLWAVGFQQGITFALSDIATIPAADVRPVVLGKWIYTGGKFSRGKTVDRRILTCSICGNMLSMEGVNAGRGDANYCPNCGADMREKRRKADD